jgi:hypothetical protein
MIKENKKELVEKIFKLAKIESEWLRHYGHIDSRKEEDFNDIKFYDRMLPIGYSKVWTPLYLRCPMGYVNSLNIDDIEDTTYGPRNHEKGVYTCLEFILHNKIDGYRDLIGMIKK